jgi:Uma2 family endonuclease
LQRLLTDEQRRRDAFVDAIQPDEKGEFINGEMVRHGPWRYAELEVHSRLIALLSTHVQHHRLGTVTTAKALISLTRNDYEPDVCFFGEEKAATLRHDALRFPAPDLVVEVLSPSTEARDRSVKMEDYAAHDVAEYWIVDPDAEAVEQYVLDGQAYSLQMKSSTGVLASVAVREFAVPVRALFDDEANLVALRDVLG